MNTIGIDSGGMESAINKVSIMLVSGAGNLVCPTAMRAQPSYTCTRECHSGISRQEVVQ